MPVHHCIALPPPPKIPPPTLPTTPALIHPMYSPQYLYLKTGHAAAVTHADTDKQEAQFGCLVVVFFLFFVLVCSCLVFVLYEIMLLAY